MTETEDTAANAESATPYSPRKQAIHDLSQRMAAERGRWIDKNRAFHQEDRRYLRFLIPEGLRILDLGCGIGEILAALKPSYGVGVDFSDRMIEEARAAYPGSAHPELTFVHGDIEDPQTLSALEGPFDVIVLSDTIGSLEDCQALLELLHPLCTRDTRVVISYYSTFWDPILRIGEWTGLKMPQTAQNSLTSADIANLLELSGFAVTKREWRQLVPRRLFGIGTLINRFVATLPLIRRLCLRNYLVACSRRHAGYEDLSATVMIPCRNERGNIEAAVKRVPAFCDDIEILFVEGHSQDGTYEEIERVIAAYPDRDIKVTRQDGKGKGDAVRKGFDLARGDVLMILDADLTMPPEDLPKFYNALKSGQGEFINGSRLVYPMESDAMRFLNLIANQMFSYIFTYLLNQRYTDTLCGTKVMTKAHYRKIEANRSYFGDFDPFGDFDLIFGASKLNLKVAEIPIRYRNRAYGETQISRFRHGLLLIRMVIFAFFKLKAI
ncbi:MAG: glycosyltransferase [Rhodospirillales bacterium]